MYSFVTDACMASYEVKYEWTMDLVGHKYAYKINHQFNFEFSCDFQGKKY